MVKTIKDYNVKLLNALYSWFWYNGLLEKQSDDPDAKWDDRCLILQLIKILKETTTGFLSLSYLKDNFDIDMYHDKELNVLWLLLVEMFGSCGTSPRSGWIEKNDECIEFLETIIHINEL